jgi:IS30 family transposase
MKRPQIKFSYISHKSVISRWLKSGETTILEEEKNRHQRAKNKRQRASRPEPLYHFQLSIHHRPKKPGRKHKIRKKVGIKDIRR